MDRTAEPSTLAPTGAETFVAVAAVVAVVFAGYAVVKVVRREWAIGHALTLAVLTFVVPFAGPVVLVAGAVWRRRRRTRSIGRAGGT